jgi:hypothetical protein
MKANTKPAISVMLMTVEILRFIGISPEGISGRIS